MDAIIAFREVSAAKGLEDQDVEFQKLLVQVVNKASKEDCRKERNRVRL